MPNLGLAGRSPSYASASAPKTGVVFGVVDHSGVVFCIIGGAIQPHPEQSEFS